jgi:hypothetical protein
MLHRGDDNLIVLVNEFAPITLGDEVDSFSRAARKNNLMCLPGVDQSPDFDARIFIFAGRQLAQIINAAVHIGVLLGVIAIDRLNHHLRFLRGGRAVQVDERTPVNLLVKDRKILADPLYVEIISH